MTCCKNCWKRLKKQLNIFMKISIKYVKKGAKYALKSTFIVGRLPRFIRRRQINPFRPIFTFHIETSHLSCYANQVTGFCMKCNTGLKWVNIRAIQSQCIITSSKSTVKALGQRLFFVLIWFGNVFVHWVSVFIVKLEQVFTCRYKRSENLKVKV